MVRAPQRRYPGNVSSLPHQFESPSSTPWLRRFPVRTPTLPPATHTNVYVLGQGDLLLVDPASPYPDEQARLLAYLHELGQAGHRPQAVLLTHHHLDHISGAGSLCQALGLPLWVHPLTAPRIASRGLLATRMIQDGDLLPLSPTVTLRALHTPGHAPGHLCLHDPDSGHAIVGDMVASVGTIVIDPDDDGDMARYLAELQRLHDLMPAGSPLCLWPAHGASVPDGRALLSFYRQHRLQREHKVVVALSHGPATVQDLLPRAYDDVPAAIYPLAACSLRAHLGKLRTEGRADADDAGVWRLVPPAAQP